MLSKMQLTYCNPCVIKPIYISHFIKFHLRAKISQSLLASKNIQLFFDAFKSIP